MELRGRGRGVEDVTITRRGFSVRGSSVSQGYLGPRGALCRPLFSKFKVFMTVSPKSIKPVKLPVFD